MWKRKDDCRRGNFFASKLTKKLAWIQNFVLDLVPYYFFVYKCERLGKKQLLDLLIKDEVVKIWRFKQRTRRNFQAEDLEKAVWRYY